jgi:6-phosphogluconolactonase (cycloisomerase 2 family)
LPEGLQPTGYPQLISVDPLPAVVGQSEGETCPWVRASAEYTLMAALSQQRPEAESAMIASADDGRGIGNADRVPTRTLRDTYPTFSAAIVDPERNEILAQDENLANIMVFDRMDNTPPNASFTEPKRMIGGEKTTLEFECGIYVDPKTGDIYSVANDTGNRLAVFPHDTKGNVPPSRVLNTPHGTYGIAVDEDAKELYLSVQGGSVVVYNKMAKDNDKPIRTLKGERTKLGGVHGIAIDTKRKLMFLANHGNFHATGPNTGGRIESSSITVYPLDANGDTAPLRVLQGPRTQLNWPALIYADAEYGELYIANDGDNSVLVFNETDGGDVAPSRVIKGAKANLREPSSVYVDTKHDELVVANMGNHSTNVYRRTANGNVAPLRIIRSAPAGKIALAIVNPGGVAYDNKRDELLVPN